MKHIFIFNDKLHAQKDELVQLIIQFLQLNFVETEQYNVTEKLKNNSPIKLKGTPRAIFLTNVKNYDSVLNIAFSSYIEIANNRNLIQTIHTPHLVFVCDFPKSEIPEAHLEHFNIISVE